MTGLHFLLVFVIIALISDNEAAAPFFLQAITSALGTIPFSAGPMTTGLVGAKLAVGSKLLYYLGFFGRRRSKPKSTPKRATPPKPNMAGMPGGFQGGFPGGMPGGFQGGFPGGMPGGFQGGFPGGMPGGFQGGFQGGMPGGFQGGMPGGFPQQFGGFGQQGFSNQNPFGGMDPSQVYQMLAAQGIDPAMAMQAMNMEGMGGGQAIPASQFPFPAGVGGGPGSAAGAGMGTASGAGHGKLPNQNQVNAPEDTQGGGGEDIESFFTFLRDMDENSCISRLMCDIGADPSFLGDFSENIHGIISSLNVLPSSGAFQYIQIMENGRREGNCGKKFPQCGDAAYEVVKNVAPSVGVPENLNIDAINKLQ